MRNKFAERLKNILKEKEMSQSELARRINISPSVVNNYCSGKKEPTLDTLYSICETLPESADYLLGLKDE